MNQPVDPIAMLESILADAAVREGWGMDVNHLKTIANVLHVLKTCEAEVSTTLEKLTFLAGDMLEKMDRVRAVANSHQADIRKIALKECYEATDALRTFLTRPDYQQLLSKHDMAELAELAKGLDAILPTAPLPTLPLVKP